MTVRNVQVSERGCAEFTCRQFWWSFDFYKVFFLLLVLWSLQIKVFKNSILMKIKKKKRKKGKKYCICLLKRERFAFASSVPFNMIKMV